jgi:hypothetical protein
MRKVILFIAGVLLMPLGLHAGSLSYATNTLQLDLSDVAFGAPLAKYPGATNSAIADMGVEARLQWYHTDASTIYETKHAGRTLYYGFKDGRLAALRVSTETAFDSNPQIAAQRKAALDGLLADFRKLGEKRLVYQDVNLRIQYTPYCSSMENFFAVIFITPPGLNSTATIPLPQSSNTISTNK